MTDAVRRITREEIEAASRALISARETNLGYEISLPLIHPTGQCASVVVTVAGGDYVVHDAGFGSMYLTSSGVDMTQRLKEKLSKIAELYGCEFVSGRMTRTCTSNQLAIATALVANASKAVADQSLEARKKKISDFRREVSSVISEKLGPKRVRAESEVVGDSGTSYRVNFIVLNTELSKAIAYVEAIGDRDAVNDKFREFFDIQANPAYSPIDRISVYDDRSKWRAGDIIMLRRVSNAVPFGDFPTRLEGFAA